MLNEVNSVDTLRASRFDIELLPYPLIRNPFNPIVPFNKLTNQLITALWGLQPFSFELSAFPARLYASYRTAPVISKMGSRMAITINPTTTPMVRMMAGSIRAVRVARLDSTSSS